MIAIIQCRIFCVTVCYPIIWRIKYTEFYNGLIVLIYTTGMTLLEFDTEI